MIMPINALKNRVACLEAKGDAIKQTLSRVEPLLSRIRATPPYDISFVDSLGIPVHLTIRVSDLIETSFHSLKEWGLFDLTHVHSGKGLTAEQSRLSCIMEAIERYSAGYHDLEGKTTTATYHDIENTAIDPRDFWLPPEVDFTPDRELVWYRGNNLFTRTAVCLPIDFVLMDIPDSAYPFTGFESKRLGFFFSNGLAAGTCIENALVSGISEVVERDAQYRIAHQIEPYPTELDLSCEEDFIPWRRLFDENRLSLRAFFLQNVEGFYSVIVTSWDDYCRMLVTGTAADTNIRRATHGAIMELVQQRSFMFFSLWRTRREYVPIIRYIREHLHPDSLESSPPSTFWTEQCNRSVRMDECREELLGNSSQIMETLKRDHQIIGLDLTHPAIGIPVVRVIISGLRNGYFDYQPTFTFVKESATH